MTRAARISAIIDGSFNRVRVFLYEYCVGGGLLGEHDAVLRSLEPEGRAMLSAIVADFVSSGCVDVVTLLDARVKDLQLPACEVRRVETSRDARDQFARLSAEVDFTLLIAPELDGALLSRAKLVEQVGGRLLSPSSEFIALAGDKLATNRTLADHNVPVPRCKPLSLAGDGIANPPIDFDFPIVIKRRDGAGSVGMRTHAFHNVIACDPKRGWIVEEWRRGDSVSVSVLCGRGRRVALPPFSQRLAPGNFAYEGGSRLVGSERIDRASRLAVSAIESLGRGALGWIGVDLVLGDAKSGGDDYVIEVNPRLTTSYIGLRSICESNLAAAMLELVEQRPASLVFSDEPIEFSMRDSHALCSTSAARNQAGSPTIS